MNTSIIYFLLACILVSIVTFGIEVFHAQKLKKVFSGAGFVEGPFMRRLVDRMLPDEKSRLYTKLSDYVFVLDSRKSIRDVYVIKIICFACSILIGLSITATNIYNRRADAFYVTNKVPIQLTIDEYNALIVGVDLKSNDVEKQAIVVKSNIGVIENQQTADKLSKVNSADLFGYLQIIHGKLTSVLGIGDLIVFIAILIVGWNVTQWIITWIISLLISRELFEFDDLETDILMMCDSQVVLILETLEKNALFYREFFSKFKDLYIDNSETAYTLVATRHEFPEHFKKLVRYLNMIEKDGTDYVKLVINSNKETTHEDVYSTLYRQRKKHVQILNIMIAVSLFLSLGRVVVSLISSVVK